MVHGVCIGSVIEEMAVETGGNCAAICYRKRWELLQQCQARQTRRAAVDVVAEWKLEMFKSGKPPPGGEAPGRLQVDLA